jgi:hypothetical protein
MFHRTRKQLVSVTHNWRNLYAFYLLVEYSRYRTQFEYKKKIKGRNPQQYVQKIYQILLMRIPEQAIL